MTQLMQDKLTPTVIDGNLTLTAVCPVCSTENKLHMGGTSWAVDTKCVHLLKLAHIGGKVIVLYDPTKVARKLTNDQVKLIANRIWENMDVEGIITSLWSRWRDEQGYEDIKDYGTVVSNWLKANEPQATFKQMNKRPFGFDYTLDGITIRVYVTGKEYGWKVQS